MIPIFHRYSLAEKAHLKIATLRERIIAQLIDGIILGVICSLSYLLISGGKVFTMWVSPIFPLYLLQIHPSYVADTANWWWGGHFVSVALYGEKEVYLAIPSLLFVFLYMGYYAFYTNMFGQTPGQMMKRLVVLKDDGSFLSIREAALRWFFMVISLIPLGAGFWWATRKPALKAWHDLWCGSQVYSF